MRRISMTFLVVPVLVPAIGCNGDGGSDAAGDGTTGISAADAVIRAIREENFDALATMVRYTEIE